MERIRSSFRPIHTRCERVRFALRVGTARETLVCVCFFIRREAVTPFYVFIYLPLSRLLPRRPARCFSASAFRAEDLSIHSRTRYLARDLTRQKLTKNKNQIFFTIFLDFFYFYIFIKKKKLGFRKRKS